jgi:hypothetical protein
MRILRAHQIQPLEDAARVAADRADGPVARLILAAYANVWGSIDPIFLTRTIADSRFAMLWRHLALDRLTPSLRPALNRLAVTHDQVAVATTADIPRSIHKARPSSLRTPDVIHLTYDPLDRATVDAQNTINDAISADIEATAQATAQQIVSDGLARGLPASVIATALHETIGLSIREATAVQNYRQALQGGGKGALQRALRDRRFDGTVRRGDFSAEQIDRMVNRYADRFRAYRASRLAITEAMRAANQGRRAAWAQYIDRTGIGNDGVRRFWLTAGDELVCPICSEIPGLNPDGVGFNEPYKTPIGDLLAPPEPHPLCRCSEQYVRTAPVETTTGSANSVGMRVELDFGT